jgi:hypothetical protein
METIWLCVLQRYADPKLYRAISLTSKEGANACRRIRDTVSVTDRFVATEQMHTGCKQMYLRGSGLLHGAYETRDKNGKIQVVYFKYGQPAEKYFLRPC